MLIGQPRVVDDDLLVRMQSLQDLASLPVPEDHVPLPVTTGYETSVWRESDGTCISGNGMTSESLLSVLSEAIGRVDEDLVVERLRREPFFWRWTCFERKPCKLVKSTLELTVRVHRYGGHRVHVGFRDILDDYRNIVVPPSNRLVI